MIVTSGEKVSYIFIYFGEISFFDSIAKSQIIIKLSQEQTNIIKPISLSLIFWREILVNKTINSDNDKIFGTSGSVASF